MSSGFLTTIAARTLGLSQVLEPVLPSRFEPTAHAPAIGEVLTADAAAHDWPRTTEAHDLDRRDHGHDGSTAAQPRWDPATSGGEDMPPAPAADRPANRAARGSAQGFAPPRSPGPRAQDLTLDGGGEPSAGGASRPWPAGETSTEPLEALADAAADQPLVPAGGRSTRWDSPVSAGPIDAAAGAEGPPASPERRGWPRAVSAAAAEPEPAPIIVRIGRVDVRAIQPAPPTPVTPKRRSAPSLAEHLRARDEGRR